MISSGNNYQVLHNLHLFTIYSIPVLLISEKKCAHKV